MKKVGVHQEIQRCEYDLPHEYSVLTMPIDTDTDHDYSEPYFEPASEVEDLLHQFTKLEIPNFKSKSLRYTSSKLILGS